MAINKITESQITTYGVQSAPDILSGSAAENKKIFDRLITNVVAVYFNALVDAIVAPTGAGEVGAAVDGIDGGTVQEILTALKALRDSDVSGQGATNSSVQTALENRYTKDQTDAKIALKFDAATANSLVKTISFNGDTGVFTITTQGGDVTTIDTMLEKVPAKFSLEGNKLVLTLEDGTKQEADLSAFIDTYTFIDSDTLKFSQNGKDVSAQVKDGSITLEKLDGTAQQTLAGYADRAEAAAEGAEGAKNAAQAARDTAQSAATTATAKAGEAAASQNAAAASEAAAADSERKAAASQQGAADSEAAAQAAQNAAESARTGAENAKDAAADSEAAAKTSETNAKASESAAAQSKTDAESANTKAQAAKTAAESAKNTATTKAGEAAESAAAAEASKTVAAGSETNAKASANTAESYAKGGTGTRNGEDTDNAKYYAGKAKDYMEQAGEIVGGDFATKSEVANAKTEAIAAAAADATTKANKAESNAKAASIPTTQKGAAGGVATLDSGGKVPTAQIPALNYDPAGSAATAKSEAIAAAALDATSKANTAKSEAITAAASDATSKANTAESNAKAASDPKGSAAEVQSNLDSHTGNSNIHVTAADKTNWNGKADDANYRSMLPSSGTALEDNTIYDVASMVNTYNFVSPTRWAHGTFIAGPNVNITCDSGRFVGSVPKFEAGKTYEFDVLYGVWAFAEVVTG